MKNYYELLEELLENGYECEDRTGTGTLSLFGKHLEFDLNAGFPLVTRKHTSFKSIAAELLWFLKGSTSINELKELNGNNNPTIWDEWAHDGDIGALYGYQWRSWRCDGERSIDQVQQLIDGLIDRPFSRRHVISAWNVADLPDENISPQDNVKNNRMALAPCHALFQFGVRKLSFEERLLHYETTSMVASSYYEDEYNRLMDNQGIPRYALICHLYQRSCDTFLGLPFNIASYALLTNIIANIVNMTPDKLCISFGDVHVYKNHIEQAKEMLARSSYTLPTLSIDKKHNTIDDFTMDSFVLNNYQSHPKITAPISI